MRNGLHMWQMRGMRCNATAAHCAEEQHPITRNKERHDTNSPSPGHSKEPPLLSKCEEEPPHGRCLAEARTHELPHELDVLLQLHLLLALCAPLHTQRHDARIRRLEVRGQTPELIALNLWHDAAGAQQGA